MTNEKRAKDKNKLVAVLDLDDSIDCDELYKFIVEHKIPKKSCVLWVSIVTDQYSSGILVPKYIMHLTCRIDCGLNFSFTIV